MKVIKKGNKELVGVNNIDHRYDEYSVICKHCSSHFECELRETHTSNGRRYLKCPICKSSNTLEDNGSLIRLSNIPKEKEYGLSYIILAIAVILLGVILGLL